MDRMENLREHIDEILLNMPDSFNRRCGYLRLYGVAQACVVIAKRRGLNAELAAMAGMLHDIYNYKISEDKNYAQKGAVIAREILENLEIVTSEEIDIICSAIHNHSDKESVGLDFDELLKDANVLQHCTYNPTFPIKEHERKRYDDLLIEFGISSN